MKTGNRSRTISECFNENDRVKHKIIKRSSHRRVHSLPISLHKIIVKESNNLEKNACMEFGNMTLLQSTESVHSLNYVCGKKPELDVMRLSLLRNWHEIELWCEDSPEKTRKVVEVVIHGEKHQSLPLHAVCTFKPPASTVVALMKVNKQATMQKGHLGLLPVHIACRHGASLEVVKILSESYPEGLNSNDLYGNSPLHYACAFSSVEVIRFLLKSSPSASKVQNCDKKLPIHHMGARNDLINISSLVLFMYAHNPDALRLEDSKGLLPIHSAVSHQASLDMIEIMISLYPQGIFVRDNLGRTPLDIAKKLRRSAHAKLVYQLLQSAWSKAGTPLTRTKSMLISHYNGTTCKLSKMVGDKNIAVRRKYCT